MILTAINAYHLPCDTLCSSQCSVEFLRAYVLASRENFLYGIGDYRISTRFGDAPIRLVEAARLKMLGLFPEMPEGFDLDL